MKRSIPTLVAIAIAISSLAFVAPAEAKGKKHKSDKTSQPHKGGHSKKG